MSHIEPYPNLIFAFSNEIFIQCGMPARILAASLHEMVVQGKYPVVEHGIFLMD